MKRLNRIIRNHEAHWVGDGFPVRTLFAYPEFGEELSPFLLLDYGGPTEFEPTDARRGVGAHPHRGFETVTIVYSGEVEHRDSSGAGGKIGPGDVQWMTAGAGVVHEEFHGRDYARRGGPFEMVQLWVNLPRAAKMTAPRYQGIRDADIPAVDLAGGRIRVIAGRFDGVAGPALTHTPIDLWDLDLDSSEPFDLPVRDGYTTALVVLRGSVEFEDGRSVGEAEVGIFDRAGDTVRAGRARSTRALLLAGEPIEEPIAGAGPFVMNLPGELRQAMLDYQTGKMGRLD
jgi:redox-sensitive bicupin YhaK (pirin superfamily)